jgi:peptide-methionine (R)-S-oxide reductase
MTNANHPLTRYRDLSRNDEGVVTLSEAEWREFLSPEEFHILREAGTEPGGTGPLTNNKAPGDYHCAGCGLHLYGSEHKFHSGCGWPSFDDEVPNAVTRHEDSSFGSVRTEIRCKGCASHLGHVFKGEQLTTKNTRHCVNSASIVFVPKGEGDPGGAPS